MQVIAKFKCHSITRSLSSKAVIVDGKTTWVPAEMRTIKLAPVYANNDPNHENSKFWQASPSGQIELGCVNLAAADGFDLDKEYYVTFSDTKE